MGVGMCKRKIHLILLFLYIFMFLIQINGCEGESAKRQKKIAEIERKEKVLTEFLGVLTGIKEDLSGGKRRSEQLASANYMISKLDAMEVEAKEVGYEKRWELLKKAVLAYKAAIETNNKAYGDEAVRYLEESMAQKD